MKAKGNRANSSPAEACGIWLDPSAGKKHGMQALLYRPSLKMNNLFPKQSSSAALEYGFTQTSPQICTLQTTISSFFRTTPTAQMLTKQDIQSNQSSAKTCHKRKRTMDLLESSNKKSRTSEPFLAQQPVDDWLSVKPSQRQKSNPLTEAAKSIPGGSYVPNSPPNSPQTTLSNDALIEMESNEMQSLVSSCLPGSQESLNTQSPLPTLLPRSHSVLPWNPDAHIESPKLLGLDILVNQISQDCEYPPLQPLSTGNHANTASPHGSFCVEGTQAQLDFTQDSEGNVVLAHRTAHGRWSQQSNGRKCSMLQGASGTRTKKENLSTKPHNNSLANVEVCSETKENLIYGEPSENSSNLENMHPGKMRPTKESVKLNYVEDKKKIHQAKCLLHHGCEGTRPSLERICSLCEGSHFSSLKGVCNTVLSTSNQDDHVHFPNKHLKDLVNTKVQKTPLGDRTNEGHCKVIKCNFRPLSGLYSRVRNSPVASQPLSSLLFTQDSEGNAVIKHW